LAYFPLSTILAYFPLKTEATAGSAQDVLRSQPGDVRMLTEFSDRIPYSLMGTCGRVVVAVLKYIEELV